MLLSQVIHYTLKEMMPVMHAWIRDLYDYMRLGQFLYARDVFPNKTPIWEGRYPESHEDAIKAKMAEGKKFMQDKARRGPLKMLLMIPDSHGTGGIKYILKYLSVWIIFNFYTLGWIMCK